MTLKRFLLPALLALFVGVGLSACGVSNGLGVPSFYNVFFPQAEEGCDSFDDASCYCLGTDCGCEEFDCGCFAEDGDCVCVDIASEDEIECFLYDDEEEEVAPEGD